MMSKSPILFWRTAALTKTEAKPDRRRNALFSQSPDGLREIVRAVMQELLEAEMTDAVGAEKGERTAARLGYRSGYYTRTLITRVRTERVGDVGSLGDVLGRVLACAGPSFLTVEREP